jgi:endonuclease G, mitochondrial
MRKLFILLLLGSSSLVAQKVDLSPISTIGQIVKHKYYTLSYSRQNKQAEWVFYLLAKKNSMGTVKRKNNFRPDPLVSTGSASLADYKNSGYDKGHLCPSADMSFDSQAMSETFYLSNMSPQVPAFNRGIWKKLEELVRGWSLQEDSLYVVTGPIFIQDKGSIGPDSVTVPGFYYKIIYDPTGDKKMIGFIIPNEKGTSKLLSDYTFTVDSIEKITRIDFFHNLPNSLEFRLEKGIDLKLWKFY